MADVHSKVVRSHNMRMIKGKNTKPEIQVRRFLFSKGFRYRLYDKNLRGSPDIVLPKYKTLIFVNGCFWHGHDNCRFFVIPKTRRQWWLEKINGNKVNDLKVKKLLEANGWKIVVVWECELKPLKAIETLTRLIEKIRG